MISLTLHLVVDCASLLHTHPHHIAGAFSRPALSTSCVWTSKHKHMPVFIRLERMEVNAWVCWWCYCPSRSDCSIHAKLFSRSCMVITASCKRFSSDLYFWVSKSCKIRFSQQLNLFRGRQLRSVVSQAAMLACELLLTRKFWWCNRTPFLSSLATMQCLQRH